MFKHHGCLTLCHRCPAPLFNTDRQGLLARGNIRQLGAFTESKPPAGPTKRGGGRTLDTGEEESGGGSPNGGPRYPPPTPHPPRTFQPDGEEEAVLAREEQRRDSKTRRAGRKAGGRLPEPRRPARAASRVHPLASSIDASLPDARFPAVKSPHRAPARA